MNTEKLYDLLETLPEQVRENLDDLLSRMGEEVEGIGDNTVKWHPTFLRLIQGSSDRSKLPKGVAPGDILIGEKKVEQPLKIIPIRLDNIRQYWPKDQTETKMICSSPDAKTGYIGVECRVCPHGQWGEDGSPSECSKVKTVTAITADLSEIITINFAKTGYSSGMEFEKLMRKAGTATFKRVYEVKSITNSKNKNVEQLDVQPLSGDDRIVPEEFWPFLQELFNQVRDDRLEMLKGFYEYIQSRKGQADNLLGDGGADSTLALPSGEGGDAEGDTDGTNDIGGEGGDSELASRYSV